MFFLDNIHYCLVFLYIKNPINVKIPDIIPINITRGVKSSEKYLDSSHAFGKTVRKSFPEKSSTYPMARASFPL